MLRQSKFKNIRKTLVLSVYIFIFWALFTADTAYMSEPCYTPADAEAVGGLPVGARMCPTGVTDSDPDRESCYTPADAEAVGGLPVGARMCPTGVTDPNPTRPPSAGVGSTVRLQNPLSGISTIPQLLAAILNIVVILAIPVIIFFIMLAGFKYVTARGNATQIQEASKALLYAVIGAVLILGATAIAQIVKNLVDAFR